MAYEVKVNTGSLFKNEHKQADNHPDYRGNVNVNGTPMDVAAWITKAKSGKTYMSLKFSPPYVKGESKQNTDPAPYDDNFDPDTDIPF